jgi:presequence protease
MANGTTVSHHLRLLLRLFINSSLTYNLTADESFQDSLEQLTGEFFSAFKSGSSTDSISTDSAESGILSINPIPFETFVTSSDVAFNAIVLPAPRVYEPGQSAFTILSHILTTNFLWEKIRVQGGAYGAHAEVNLLEGLFTMSSYRDPRIAGSYKDFTDSLKGVANGDFSSSLVEKSIISLISRDLRPITPREKSMLGFRRNMFGISDELRQRRREEFFAMKKETVSQAAETLLAAYENGDSASVTIAGQELVDANHKKFPKISENIKILIL